MDEAQARSALGAYATPPPSIAASLQDSFLVEMVYAMQRSIAQRVKRELPERRRRAAILARAKVEMGTMATVEPETKTDETTDLASRRKDLQSIVQKYTSSRLESLGFRVGTALIERLTIDIPKPGAAALASDSRGGLSALNAAQLDIVKFVCKDVWIDVFGKQVDGLKTNHRGTFVLQDDTFRWLARFATAEEPSHATTIESARQFTYFPAGIIRGALQALGMGTLVTCEINPAGPPSCTFQVRVTKGPDV